MTPDYTQTFFKLDDKEKLREFGVGRGFVRVRQIAVKAPVVQISQPNNKEPDLRNNSEGNQRTQLTKPPPLCFVCNDFVSKHFLADCKTFKTFTNERKKRVVVGAGRCLNCFSLGHMVQNWMVSSKCRRCGPACSSKHAGALHELYVRFRVGSGNGSYGLSKVIDTETRESSTEDEQSIVRKLTSNNNNTVLLRTSAMSVINLSTGKSTLVYAQHDSASQATLIPERLKNELTIRTLAQQTTSSGGLTEFTLQSLSTNEISQIKNALVVSEFADNESTLPHAVNVEKLEHFQDVTIPVIAQRKSIDILIGQTNKSLLTV